MEQESELTPEERRNRDPAIREKILKNCVKLEPEELDPEVFHIPANYDSLKPIYRGLQEEGEDLGERLTNDPSYIDRI
ncbi:MAG: hypothetical protein WBB28_04470 [Crinalium sp.]